MTTKTISITEEVYSILNAKKNPSESFSEIIIRLSGKKNLSDFYGALSKKSADDLESSIKETRKLHNRLHQQRIRNEKLLTKNIKHFQEVKGLMIETY